MNPWKIIFVTAVLSAIVSFAVSGIIHLLCLMIQRFAKTAPAAPKAAAPAADHGAEIAIAIAAAKACLSQGK